MDKENRCPNGDGYNKLRLPPDEKRVPKIVELPRNGERWTTDNFNMGKKLGRGAFGVVVLAQEKKSKDLVAMKAMNKVKLAKEKDLKRLRREIDIQSYLHRGHQNIMPLRTFFFDKTHVYLILDYCSAGSLKHHMSNFGPFDEARTKHILTQAASALNFCHSKLVMHRDIKPDNILLTENGDIKIADFGLARLKMAFCGPWKYSLSGTPPYWAPEIVACLEYDEKVDIWSLGVTLYELLFGRLPFAGDSKALDGAIVNVDYYDNDDRVSASAKDLISQFLQKDPSNRIELAQVPNHEWFHEVVPDPVLD